MTFKRGDRIETREDYPFARIEGVVRDTFSDEEWPEGAFDHIPKDRLAYLRSFVSVYDELGDRGVRISRTLIQKQSMTLKEE
jgi:hypothetical protein